MGNQEQPKFPAASGEDASASIPIEIQIDVESDEPTPEQLSYLTPTPPGGTPIPREHGSGGIAIGGGDFATPAPDGRRRRTTQPRGLAVVVEAADVPTPAPSIGLDTAAAAIVGTNGLLSLFPDGFEEPTPAPEDITLTTPTAIDLPRIPALESAPPASRLTPTPVMTATPPPVLVRPPVSLTPEALTPLPVTPGPDLLTPLPHTPAPAPRAAASVEPAPPAATATPPPPPTFHTESPAGVRADATDATAIPARPLPEMDSEGNLSPLAQTLAHMAEAARAGEANAQIEGDVSADDEVELVDSPLTPAPALAAPVPAPRKSMPPPPPVAVASPPPIPAAPPRTPAQLLNALPVPEALSPRPRRPKRSKPWFEEVFDEDYLRTLPVTSGAQTAREAGFIVDSLEAPSGAELLDVACGYGRHAVELAARGFSVTGLDLSLPMLIRAADEAQRRAVSVNFVHADMREMAFERQFDGAYCMLTSFGYFDEDANLKVAEGIARALKPGARLLIEVVNRDYVVGDLPTRIWCGIL